MKVDKKNYLKDRILSKNCYNDKRRKKTITPIFKMNNQKLKKLIIAITIERFWWDNLFRVKNILC